MSEWVNTTDPEQPPIKATPMSSLKSEWLDFLSARKLGMPLRDALEGLRDVVRRLWPRQRIWTPECRHCEDTGFDRAECDGELDSRGFAFCNREFFHAPHVVVWACPCRATNRTYQRHHPRPGQDEAGGLAAMAQTKTKRR